METDTVLKGFREYGMCNFEVRQEAVTACILSSAAVSSTMLYNLLNFPAGVVPVSTVTEADEEELKLYKGCCNDPWDRTLKQVWEVVEQRLLMGVQITIS